jgi:hypothetical protein
VHDGLRLKVFEYFFDQAVISQVSVPKAEVLAITLAKTFQPVLDPRDGRSAPRPHFLHPFSTEKKIRPGDLMSPGCQMLSESPAEITIDTRNEDPHVFLLVILLVLEKIKNRPNVETTKLQHSGARNRNVTSLLGRLNLVLP